MSSDADTRKLYKIGEVCRMADVQPYVLRYWETEFPPLAPNKSGGGQRLYSQHEIDVILRIKKLLYAEGFTIAGAKKKLEQEMAQGDEPVVVADEDAGTAPAPRQAMGDDARKIIGGIKRELRELLKLLEDS